MLSSFRSLSAACGTTHKTPIMKSWRLDTRVYLQTLSQNGAWAFLEVTAKHCHYLVLFLLIHLGAGEWGRWLQRPTMTQQVPTDPTDPNRIQWIQCIQKSFRLARLDAQGVDAWFAVSVSCASRRKCPEFERSPEFWLNSRIVRICITS